MLQRPLCTLAALVTLICAAVAEPARADWLKAESPRFVVYSSGSEQDLRAYVAKLETFDRLLRLRTGQPVDGTPLRKLPIYVVDAGGLRRISPGIGDGVAGFYAAREEDIFAVAIRGGFGDEVLLHEYAHHYMRQNIPGDYPAWFVEGFAEYYMTVDIEPDEIELGMYNEGRGSWLRGSTWISMRDLLSKRAGEVRQRSPTYYPLAWLLTHWFLSDDTRLAKLNSYLADVAAGADPVEAIPRATGLTIGELRRELRRHMGRLPYQKLTNPFGPVEITVTRLPPSADDFLLLNQRLTGVPTSHSDATLREVRRLAARHPEAPDALLALGHAEVHLGDRDQGETVLRRLIGAHPQHVEGLQYLAMSLLERAEEDGADVRALKAEARSLLARAYALDDANYRTFMLMGRLREGEAGYPNANDIATRELAMQLAPQLGAARMQMGEAYLAAGRRDDAIRVLEPLANAPHGGEQAKTARTLLDRARGLSQTDAVAEERAADEVDEEPTGD